MGRTHRNCPVFGCTSTNLVRLANHLDQVHHMEQEERKKWLNRSKMGLCNTLQGQEIREYIGKEQETCVQKSFDDVLQRQNEIERKFYTYLRDRDLDKKIQSHKNSFKKRGKSSYSKEGYKVGAKWLTYEVDQKR